MMTTRQVIITADDFGMSPEVNEAVEEAHRRHLGSLTWESAWVAVCLCGWRSGRLSQQAAWDELAAHEASFLRPAARGEPLPPAP